MLFRSENVSGIAHLSQCLVVTVLVSLVLGAEVAAPRIIAATLNAPSMRHRGLVGRVGFSHGRTFRMRPVSALRSYACPHWHRNRTRY